MSDIGLNLLALGLQAKLARDAAHDDKDHDRILEAREQDRHGATLLLTRVRTQMMDVYRPITAAAVTSLFTMEWMARELDFEWIRLSGFDACFMRPSERLYPHLEVHTRESSPYQHAHGIEAQGATMWHKWSPGDLQVRRGAPIHLILSQLCPHSHIKYLAPSRRQLSSAPSLL